MMDHDADMNFSTTNRRQALRCLGWAGGGLLWSASGGLPGARLLGSAQAATSGFSFVQISDSHIGFDKPANPDSNATFAAALDKIKALPTPPDFILHTGDISHSATPEQFSHATEALDALKIPVFYVPGEHDIVDPVTFEAFKTRFGAGAKNGAFYSFDHKGAHFVGLNNVVELKTKGMGYLGPDQLAWLADDLKDKSSETPIIVFGHIPLWTIAPEWGWGTQDGAQALSLLARFASVTVLNGHVHQIFQKTEGAAFFHTARSTAFPQPAPGTAPAPGPLKVPAGQLRGLLGVANILVKPGAGPLALTDSALEG